MVREKLFYNLTLLKLLQKVIPVLSAVFLGLHDVVGSLMVSCSVDILNRTAAFKLGLNYSQVAHLSIGRF